MRKLLISATILALAAPAPLPAQDHRHRTEEKIAHSLPSPHEAERMGRAIGDAADAMLDIPVGPLLGAIEPARRHERRHGEHTIGDIASRDDPYYRERMRHSVDAVSIGMGHMVQELAILAPVLARTIEDIEHRLDAITYELDDPYHR